ncbi:hypothetical protein EWM64_g4926 [Hericium alpestre]|uniref:Uncharacterized protein n=1 Tax=Hericium alpestre TaxID=135208 RepID=A0A4Y9ZY24_9AGAM|nr:hypothetical protein EWM64_g4926 [Hericium alpestre]
MFQTPSYDSTTLPLGIASPPPFTLDKSPPRFMHKSAAIQNLPVLEPLAAISCIPRSRNTSAIELEQRRNPAPARNVPPHIPVDPSHSLLDTPEASSSHVHASSSPLSTSPECPRHRSPAMSKLDVPALKGVLNPSNINTWLDACADSFEAYCQDLVVDSREPPKSPVMMGAREQKVTSSAVTCIGAMDANFRLKSCLRTSEEHDPSLGSSFAYFVESKGYGKYVVEHTSEEDISTCIAFAAFATANLKRSTGLAATGVGTVTCGRHQFWRPNGIGDLQKGERYINMDYIFLSTLMGVIIKMLVSSYDLACQWEKKFWPRIGDFPSDMQQSLAQADVIFLVLEFHLQAHEESCHSKYSSRRTVGMDRSELEGPERNWAWLNGAAASTKEMGPGSRRDTLDDFCGFSNWRRVVGMGSSLLHKMLEAIPNAIDFHYAFDHMVASFCDKHPEDLDAWEAMFAAWDADKKKKPSPFATLHTKKTLVQIKWELKDKEQAALGAAGEVEDDTSPSSFLLLGIEIQHAQRMLLSEVRATKSPTTLQLSDIDAHCHALRRKIRCFRRQQAIHMPETQATGIDEAEDGAATAADQAQAEEAELKMPSDFESTEM